jgi:hypothetical protein
MLGGGVGEAGLVVRLGNNSQKSEPEYIFHTVNKEGTFETVCRELERILDDAVEVGG